MPPRCMARGGTGLLVGRHRGRGCLAEGPWLRPPARAGLGLGSRYRTVRGARRTSGGGDPDPHRLPSLPSHGGHLDVDVLRQ